MKGTTMATKPLDYDAELAEMLKNPPTKTCVIGDIILNHPNGHDIRAAVSDPRWSAAQLKSVISKRVKVVSAEAIIRHRKAQCPCERIS